MRPANKKIKIITLNQPQKLPDDFVPRHLGIVTTAVNQIFQLALEVAMSTEPTNGLISAQSARFCRAVVCSDVASSSERLVVNNAAPQLWKLLRTASAEHAEKFRNAILPSHLSSSQRKKRQNQNDDDDDDDDDQEVSATKASTTTTTSNEDVDALKNIARLWISWSGAVHFIQHLLSWMEKSADGGAASGSSSIRATCFSAFSSKLVARRSSNVAGAGAGIAALNAAVRGFILCLRAHRNGDDDIPLLEMASLKNVMLQCDCYGDESSSALIAEEKQHKQPDAPLAGSESPQLTLPASAVLSSSRPLHFLPAYLNETKVYYSREARELLTGSTSGSSSAVVVGGTGALCEYYASHVHQRLNEERGRSQHFLASFSRPLADAVMQQCLVAPPFDEVVDRDFAAAVAKAANNYGGSSNSGDDSAAAMMGARTASSGSSSSALFSRTGSSGSGSGSGLLGATKSGGAFLPFASAELAVLYRLFVFACLPHVGADKVGKLHNAFKQFVASEATMVVSNAQGSAQEAQMVPQLLQLYARCEAIVATCFRNDEDFKLRFRESVQKALRVRQTKVAELVARQFDVLLREGDKSGAAAAAAASGGNSAGSGSGLSPTSGNNNNAAATSSDTTLATLDRLCRFARLVPAKDIFETFYMSNMAKRLLHFRSTYGGGAGGGGGGGGLTAAAAQNEDLEHTVISRLKHICGPTIATRCTGMMKDLEQSRDFVAAVSDRMLEKDPGGMLDALVLTQGYWPMGPDVYVPMPGQLEELTDYFSDLYAAEFKRRRLNWSPLLSTAVVRAQFFPRGAKGAVTKKEFTVSFLQSQILLALSGRTEPMAENDLRKCFEGERPVKKKKTGADAADAGGAAAEPEVPRPGAAAEAEKALNEALQCAIFSLISAKLIVTTERHDSVTSITKLFEANRGFSHRQTKIRVAQVQLRAAEETQQAAQSTIALRAHTVDAAIARIMKAKKRVAHWDLVTQTLELTKLPLDPSDIKKRIESLIDKNFIQRDTEDPSTYVFIA